MNENFKYPDWRSISNKLKWRDTRVLNDKSIFEVLDAKRKTDQIEKDFINDQDSVSGPGIVDNMIRNILTVRSGTFRGDNNFGIRLDNIIFEQLDWANLEFIRTVIMSNLHNQLPSNVTVTHVELSTNETWDTLHISVIYEIRIQDGEIHSQKPGPETIGDRKAYVTLSLPGIRG